MDEFSNFSNISEEPKQTQSTTLDQEYCKRCGALVNVSTQCCPSCGAIRGTFKYRSRIAAALLAVFGGSFGLHRFFLGQWWGILYLLTCWTFIPLFLGMLEGLVFLSTNQDKWNRKYNRGISLGSERGGGVALIAMIFPPFVTIAILVALAVPAYDDYSVRAKVAECLNSAAVQKLIISEYYSTVGVFPDTTTDAGLDNPAGFSQFCNGYVNPSRSDDYFSFEIDVKEEVLGHPGITIQPMFSASPDTYGEVQWACSKGSTDVKYLRFLPSTCRN